MVTRAKSCPTSWLHIAAFLGLGLLVAFSPALSRATKNEPQTFSELRLALPKAASAQAAVFKRFALDGRPALSDRLLAANAWRRSLNKQDSATVDTYLVEAHLRTLGNAHGLRSNALKRAAALLRNDLAQIADLLDAAKQARSSKKRRRQADKALLKEAKNAKKRQPALVAQLAHLEGVLEGDRALLQLRRAIKSRAKSKRRDSPQAKEVNAMTRLRAHLADYRALHDQRQAGEAKLALALFLEYSDAPRRDVDRALSRLVRVGGRHRDLARVRQKVRRARARVLADLQQFAEAVHESLVADRALGIPLHLPAFSKATPKAYARSRQTAELCFAAQKRGVRCAEIEASRSGTLSFYDYSQERSRQFNPQRAQMALAEFQPLLRKCITGQASAGRLLQNTTVELEWSIGLNGQVGSFNVLPRRLRGTPFERCLDVAFTRFRFPRYAGEMQHMQMNFSVGD